MFVDGLGLGINSVLIIVAFPSYSRQGNDWPGIGLYTATAEKY